MKRTLLALLAFVAITSHSMNAMSFFEEEEIENIEPQEIYTPQESYRPAQKKQKPLDEQLDELDSSYNNDIDFDMEIE